MRRRALLVGLAAGATTALAGCTDAGSLLGDPVQETRERDFDVPDAARVRVENENGDVDVTGREKREASVDAVVTAPGEDRLGDVTVSVTENADEIGVDVDIAGSTSNVSVDLDVRVPEDAPLAPVVTTNGDVEIRGVAAVEAARSSNGSVSVRNAGPVESVTTENGDVHADVPAPLVGDVLLRTENGDVDAAVSPDVDAAVEARTENGDVSVSGLDLADANVSETRVAGTLGDGTNDLTAVATNGGVTLESLDG